MHPPLACVCGAGGAPPHWQPVEGPKLSSPSAAAASGQATAHSHACTERGLQRPLSARVHVSGRTQHSASVPSIARTAHWNALAGHSCGMPSLLPPLRLTASASLRTLCCSCHAGAASGPTVSLRWARRERLQAYKIVHCLLWLWRLCHAQHNHSSLCAVLVGAVMVVDSKLADF